MARVDGPSWRPVNSGAFLTSELTARVDGVSKMHPSWRPVNSGAFFDTRQLGCQKMHPRSRAVNSARELGPWTRVVETGLYTLLFEVTSAALLTNDVDVSLVGFGRTRASIHVQQVLFQIKHRFLEVMDECPSLYFTSYQRFLSCNNRLDKLYSPWKVERINIQHIHHEQYKKY